MPQRALPAASALGLALTLAPVAPASNGVLEDAMARLRSSRRKDGLDLKRLARQAMGENPDAAAVLDGGRSVTRAAMPADIPGAAPAPGTGVAVPVRRRRRLKKLKVSLDWVPLRMKEDQAETRSTTFVSIGRRVDTSVSFLPGGNIRENKEENAASLGVFLSQPATHLYGLRLKVLSFTDGKGIKMEGRSPPRGRLEVVKVREVGDVRGETVGTVSDIAFMLGGKETVIPLDLAADPERRYMFVLSIPAPEGETAAVNLPVSTEGTYPALVLDPKTQVPERRDKPLFDAAAVIEYKPDPRVVRPHAELEGDFLTAIEDYLASNPKSDSVPLRVLVE